MAGRRAKNLAGKKYGRLRVLRQAGRDARGLKWLCRCACGREVEKYGARLRAGKVQSCGYDCRLRRSQVTAAGKRRRDLAVELRRQGRTHQHIADVLKVSRQRVQQLLKLEGLE